MRIQDTIQSDGISYESGDELSETDSDSRSSQEKLDWNNSSLSSPTKDQYGNYSHQICKTILIGFFFLKS